MIPEPYSFSKILSLVRSGGEENTGDPNDRSQPEAHGHREYSACRPLPASYMSGYSGLGLVVDNLDQAIQTLSGNELYVTSQVFGAELNTGNSAQVPEIVEMLLGAGNYCSIRDVIDSVYQGL